MPAAKTKPASRAKRPKAVVQEEFEEIVQEVNREKETRDAKAEETARLHATELRLSVEGVSVETAVQSISALGLEISRALAGISEKLTGEVERLADVREAVEIENKELARLHKIDVAATALDQLVEEHRRQTEQFESDMAARRAGWAEESKTVERERKEQEESLKKWRQRELEDYEYKKNLERKKAQDKYEEEIKLTEKQNREKQEALEKSWHQREAALKEREEELARLKKEAESFPARLDAESKRAAVEAAKKAEAQLQQEIVLLKKDAEAERRIADLRAKALEELTARQTVQIGALEKQLDEAKQQVQAIAVKAIEGASGANALAHVNQIAIEQAKQRPQRD